MWRTYWFLVLGCAALTGCILDRSGTRELPPVDGGGRSDGGATADASDCTPGIELCDGIDNDCDPSTPDGAAELERCDSPDDADSCTDDTNVCDEGVLRCVDNPTGTEELCDGVDNDCDPATPDGADDPAVGRSCADAGLCGRGDAICTAGALACGDTGAEECNGRDDNCDGDIDESGCQCERVLDGDRRYLFCDELLQVLGWTGARDRCREWGYELASIEDMTEQTFVATNALSRHDGSWWIGAHDMGTEGSFEWVGSGAAVGYTNWVSGQPDDFAFSQDCTALTNENGSATQGGWYDRGCWDLYRYVCEQTP